MRQLLYSLLLVLMALVWACGEEEADPWASVYIQASTIGTGDISSSSGRSVSGGDSRSLLFVREDGFSRHVPLKSASDTPLISVYIEWEQVDDAYSYNIYRRSPTGQEQLIGSSVYGNSFNDESSQLEVGASYAYAIAPLNGGTESDRSPWKEVAILPVYTLMLSGPQDYGTISTSAPTFSWIVSPQVGDVRTDLLLVRHVLGDYTWQTILHNTASFQYDGLALLSGTLYEWDIMHSNAYKYNNGDMNLVSVSYPRIGNYYGQGSNNGRWYFTISP